MKRLGAVLVLSLVVTACAARSQKEAAAPASAASEDAAPAAESPAGGYAQPGAYPAQQGAPAPAPPPAPPAEPSGQVPSRSLAIQNAKADIEAAQRELDVAGSSCQNACRALGSMDRAAGHLCQLTREDASQDRCDDAKRRLYGARDRVRSTCGRCPDDQPSVDRHAPIPSVR